MRERFEAKHIKEALKIDQRRLQYITDKMRIDPDIEAAGGTGRSHVYSLKNFLQIAFAHRLSAMGLPPDAVRFTLDHINKVDEEYGIGIYDPTVYLGEYRLKIYNEIYPPFLFFDGEPPEHILKKLQEDIEPYVDVHGDGIEPWEDPFNKGKLIYPPTPEEYVKTQLNDKIYAFNNEISHMGRDILREEDMGNDQVAYLDLTPTAAEEFYLFLEGYLVLNLLAIKSKITRYSIVGF